MSKFTKGLGATLCTGLLSLTSLGAHAALPDCYGFFDESDINTEAKLANWMGLLDDNQPVYTVTIPGSHDTATYTSWTSASSFTGAERYSVCQNKTIEEQLAMGIRAFDFRPGIIDTGNIFHHNYELNCDHGGHQTTMRYKEAIGKLTSFLKAHPTEFFVIHIYPSNSTENSHLSSLMNDLMNGLDKDGFLINFRPDLTVGEMRGKILFLVRNKFHDLYAMNHGGYMPTWAEEPDLNLSHTIVSYDGDAAHTSKLLIQDRSDYSNKTDKANKVKEGYIQSVLDKMAEYGDWTSNTEPLWCLNLISGYSKTDEVAGQSISKTNGYRENAEITNTYVYKYLSNLRSNVNRKAADYKPAGIVFADYVGSDVTESYKYLETNIPDSYSTMGASLVKELILNNVKVVYDYYIVHDSDNDAYNSYHKMDAQDDHVTYKYDWNGDLEGHSHFMKVPASIHPTELESRAATILPSDKHHFYAVTNTDHFHDGRVTMVPGHTYDWSEAENGTLFSATGYNGTYDTVDGTHSALRYPKFTLVDDTDSNIKTVSVSGETSAIDNISTDSNEGPAVYYNLQGIEVAPSQLTPGIYVKVTGNGVKKVVID